MNTYYYHLYGLTLASPIEFPEIVKISKLNIYIQEI